MDAPKPIGLVLNDSRAIRLRVPSGANAIRVTTDTGKRAVVQIDELRDDSPLYRAGPFVAVEAGKLDKGSFTPVRGKIEAG